MTMATQCSTMDLPTCINVVCFGTTVIGRSQRLSCIRPALPPTMNKSSACSCRPTLTHPSTRRYVLPQGIAYVEPDLLETRPCGSLPSIRFGASGFALGHFDGFKSIDDVARNLPQGLKKSFRWYANGGLAYITLHINVSCSPCHLLHVRF